MNDGKRVDDAIMVDGAFYYIFNEERGRKILTDLSSYMLLKAESIKLQDLLNAKDSLIQMYLDKISYIESQNKYLRDYAMAHGPTSEPPFYKSQEFSFAIGLLAGVGTVYTSSILIKNIR